MENNRDTLEIEKWYKWKYAILYHGHNAIGYCITSQEADTICEQIPSLQWDYSRKINDLPLLTINSIRREEFI